MGGINEESFIDHEYRRGGWARFRDQCLFVAGEEMVAKPAPAAPAPAAKTEAKAEAKAAPVKASKNPGDVGLLDTEKRLT